MNSNNILISDNNDLVFIDFQDTGRGHVFEDFVVFETSIRLYCNCFLSFSKLLKMETDLYDFANELPYVVFRINPA